MSVLTFLREDIGGREEDQGVEPGLGCADHPPERAGRAQWRDPEVITAGLEHAQGCRQHVSRGIGKQLGFGALSPDSTEVRCQASP